MADYNLVIIGAGPGGYVAAIRGAQKGLKVAVVEKGHVGGCCLNVGCVPTKSLMHAAHLYREMTHAEILGISADGISVDITKMYENKNKTVDTLRGGIEQLFKANGVDLYKGKATITGKNTVVVEESGEILNAENIMIAVGGKPQRLAEKFMALDGVYTSDDILGDQPIGFKRVVIIGAGVIALEFASLYSDLGCEVTVVVRSSVLRKMDREISQNITMIMKKRGVRFETGALLSDIEKTTDGLRCVFNQKEEELVIECDAVIAAMGRNVNAAGLFSGIEAEMDGDAIVVNEYFQTNIPNIYAIGDCTKGSIQLAHAASAEGINAVSHIVGEAPDMDANVVPSCIYTDPEIAVVGLAPEEAKEKGIAVKTGKYIMTGNAKSMLSNQERGFIKLLFNEETEEIIGATLVCARATDMIGELATAITNKLTVTDMAQVIRPHPTFVEGVSEAVEDAHGMAIHIAPKRK